MRKDAPIGVFDSGVGGLTVAREIIRQIPNERIVYFEDVIKAAKTVCAHDFIMGLENGYYTEVNERGSRLSAGQRQLISFARAVLADPKILILDEATSSIDTETEILLQKGLNELLKGRTSFIIAHRLSTIVNSDVILVMDHGRIIERGDHDTLMEQGGIYYRLYTGGLEID